MTKLSTYHPAVTRIIENINKVIIGKQEPIILSLTALLAGGHVLLEDVPGVGKTMLVRSLARSVDCDFKRIQFTPDLLPSDVTGVSIYNPKTLEFEFRPGPILGNIVLADEINRTSPKTQSSLLEAMEEKNITVEGNALPLADPFFVMATQNPVDYEGTYPLPEAQLDRFLLKIQMGYPNAAEELRMLSSVDENHPITRVEPVMTKDELVQMQRDVTNVYMDRQIQQYIVNLAQASRKHPDVYLGLSPRGSIALARAAKAYAYIHYRDYVIPDDVQTLAPYVIGHRVLLRSEARYDGLTPEKLIQRLLEAVEVPVEKESVHER
ncbi:MoxR-like ATPase [Terribacillus aidingensis]|uniref:MoxR-like ATPase n=1 Tax=Terribacillus aidingensis TaxID=586416 RepID=A0A285P242_9BACI|nr:MoxR family ATPase [Terribacillus aidingensis]SNZ15802.1 MoxR-like ATPase [Terribacillus aidingensis]